MINIKRFLWMFFLLIASFLISALFFITNKESSKIKHQQSPTISSSFVSNSIPELKHGINEREQSGKSVKVEIATRVLPESSSITMKQDEQIENEEIVVSKDERLNILFWNAFFKLPFFGMGMGNKGFVQHKCKYQNCYTTNERKKLGNNDTRIDAVVVHGIDKDLAKSANKNNFRQELKENNQGHYPLFVYFDKEPPRTFLDKAYKKQSNLFDITYTYRRDSDIPFPYGKVIPRYLEYNQEYNKILQSKLAMKWRPVPKDLPSFLNDRDFSYKTKDILWMVSHCKTDSRREDYVKKLQSHLSTLSVDIMGKCGNNSLPNKTDGTPYQDLQDRENMYKKYLKPYKFYLSFENANCFDYITEKFFVALKTEDVIPIALGGASVDDYTSSAPPHSYIHVDEYPTVEALANKLEYLAQNQTAYKEYFWWTKYYQVTGLWDQQVSAQCDLCEKMNLVHQQRLKLEPTNLSDFQSSEKNCHYKTSRFL